LRNHLSSPSSSMRTSITSVYAFFSVVPSLALATFHSNCTNAGCASNDTLPDRPDCHFLRNGTFSCLDRGGQQTYPNITCPGPVDGGGRCKAINHCYLPAGTTVDFNHSQKCSSTNSQLVSLGVYNGFVAATSVFAGHSSVRRRLAWFDRSKSWTPWAGMITAANQIIAMMISTGVTRGGGPGTEFAAILGLWTMRPRIGFITYVWASLCVCFGRRRKKTEYYSYTLKDIILSENILNILAFFFAVKLLRSRHIDQYGCRVPDYEPPDISFVYSSLGYATFTGVFGAFILSWLIVRRCIEKVQPDEDCNNRVTMAFHLVSFVHMIAAFASNWVLWGGKLPSPSPSFIPNPKH
jgi:hypothetical protein